MNKEDAIDKLLHDLGIGEVVCSNCMHDVYSHFYNGAGSPENSGWDSCKISGCDCKGVWEESKPNTIDEADGLVREFIPSKQAKQAILDLIREAKIEEVKNIPNAMKLKKHIEAYQRGRITHLKEADR